MSGISIQKEIATLSSTSLQVNDEFNNHGIGESPISNIFRINFKAMVLNNLDSANFDKVLFSNSKWTYNPKLFAIDYYKDENLALIILLVNSMKSMFDFKATNLVSNLIIAPNIDILYHILSKR